jgi:hypothetical protein
MVQKNKTPCFKILIFKLPPKTKTTNLIYLVQFYQTIVFLPALYAKFVQQLVVQFRALNIRL